MADTTFHLKVVTPERIFFEAPVEMVEFNTTEGELGIYANHVPLTVIVSPGVLTITTSEGEKKAALHAGFVEILQAKVTILAGKHDNIPESAFLNAGRIDEVVERANKKN